ncbi:CDP-diacylglycerol--glycerol-3-phosphate 3-phosphatidyltransferase [Puccinia graminis f. sp. tritici]|uniref:CDP-diacylglycerol--glycerol-3-phosphate 3-phosphatidyltransferase n=1 Tax=Puccinia graminis f. sp. tritici TaxID=56615 RepID=A0A5B0M5P6_PUCGR|nr:CDP-diacylglycerol--glycerol-3-phosphate 3-phosphatidyltransferase [Puccinia graminis f. sp. tritici]KAA1071493.1 CDP-diacylglycerol--glycerol-3-phosphate 3-phosphatidyltransferase [Puccinia graminis f. sp. tritici]
MRFPDQVEICLFHTSELFGILKRFVPRRFDEGFGLQHKKIYGADQDVIMSG